jgi:2-polyprenyl-3-methyl-5-hydroxy-6-metoxy-1,4-benzoquinol methylase
MTLPWPLSGDNTAKLAPAPVEEQPPTSEHSQRPLLRRVARLAAGTRAGRATRRGAEALLRHSVAEYLQRQQDHQHELDAEIYDLRVQIARLSQAPNWYDEGLRRDTNLELLKAEVRSLERSVLELGMQLAPATGLAGVGARFGELREQVNAVSRRTQQLDQTVRQLTDLRAGGAAESPKPPDVHDERSEAPAPSGMDLLFDYVAFERRFRGSPEEILRVQQERYADLLTDHAPVLDWGCGRGELLELLASRGADVVGVEIDAGMVSEARSRGLTVHQQDAVSYLTTCKPESLGSVFSAHVAEHIPFPALLEVIHASLRALRPGGVFVAETPNPTSLIVPSNSFILDPTHLRPIHPSLFAFTCETAGFRDVRLQFYAPATGYQLSRFEDDGSERTTLLNAAVDRLNDVLFGPQEYAIVATKAVG